MPLQPETPAHDRGRFRRRRARPLLALLVFALALGCSPRTGDFTQVAASPPLPASLDPFFDDLEQRTFRYFWETTNPRNGLVPDRSPTPSFSSIAAVGFALTAYPIGVERGYVSREQARERVLATLRFFHDARQGPQASGATGYHGFFYHFLDMRTGHRFERTELSTVDSALLIAGMLFCSSYFDRDNPEEAEIRSLAEEIYRRADWRWAQVRAPAISMGWTPEEGYHALDWRGYNEAMLVYILALGSPTHSVAPEAWSEWTRSYDATWGRLYGQEHLSFAPLFGHHYSHAWVDFRGIRDSYMTARRMDYFENSRRATYAQRAYAVANPMGWKGYGENVWGLTACDGPAEATLEYRGERRRFKTYTARGVGILHTVDDGTICPSAAAGSIPFAPEIALPALLEMKHRLGQYIYSEYGFLGALNESFEFDVPLQSGRVIPGFGWVAGDYLGIDQGIIIAMLENHRSQLVWRVMRTNPHIRRGLQRAGFSGGWLDTASPR